MLRGVEDIVVKLSRDMFIEEMDFCEKVYNNLRDAGKYISEEFYSFVASIIESKVNFLNELLELEDYPEFGTVIDHYVFESDFGKKSFSVYDKNGLVLYKMSDSGKLWEWIVTTGEMMWILPG